jgi:hypothetical protein
LPAWEDAIGSSSFRRRACGRDVLDPADRETERREPGEAYLTDTLSSIAVGHLINRIPELMPWAHQYLSFETAA